MAEDKPKTEEKKKSDFVKMEKDGFVLEVHPDTVTAHEAAGYKRAADDAELSEIPEVEAIPGATEAVKEGEAAPAAAAAAPAPDTKSGTPAKK